MKTQQIHSDPEVIGEKARLRPGMADWSWSKLPTSWNPDTMVAAAARSVEAKLS